MTRNLFTFSRFLRCRCSRASTINSAIGIGGASAGKDENLHVQLGRLPGCFLYRIKNNGFVVGYVRDTLGEDPRCNRPLEGAKQFQLRGDSI
jgi:hypothetical protein